MSSLKFEKSLTSLVLPCRQPLNRVILCISLQTGELILQRCVDINLHGKKAAGAGTANVRHTQQTDQCTISCTGLNATFHIQAAFKNTI